MKVILFSDPHLGLKRAANTTKESRKELDRKIASTLDRILDEPAQYKICLGDLFDKPIVDYEALALGKEVVSRVNLNLMGNHDYPNRKDSLSAFELIHEFDNKVIIDPTQPSFEHRFVECENESLFIGMVNHKVSNTLFSESLDKAKSEVKEIEKFKILLLHCNYNTPFAQQGSTLNLTEEQAKELLEVYDYIFIGHEHESKTFFDGRLVLTGNIHPTGFSDISHKCFWVLKINEGRVSLKPEYVWVKDYYTKLVINSGTTIEELSVPKKAQFVEFTGECDQDKLPSIAKYIIDLWDTHPNLLAVKNSVTAKEQTYFTDKPNLGYLSLPDKISKELSGSALQSSWKKYLERLL